MPNTPADWQSQFAVQPAAAGDHSDPVVVQLADGRVVVVAEQQAGGADSDIVATLLDPAGAPVSPIIPVNGGLATPQTTPSIASLSYGRFIVAYEGFGASGNDLFYDVFLADGARESGGLLFDDAAGGSAPRNPVVAQFDADTVGFAFVSDNPDGSDTLSIRIFNPLASTFDAPVDIATSSTTSQIGPLDIVGFDQGPGTADTFLIAFGENDPVNGNFVNYGVFDIGGNVGFIVNIDTPGGTVAGSSVANLDNGRAVTAYAVADGATPGVMVQIREANGLGGPVITVDTAAGSSNPAVTRLPDGGFVVFWVNGGAIRGQRLDSAGAAVGAAFAVASLLTVSNPKLDVTTLADGRLYVAWHDAGETQSKILTVADAVSGPFHPQDWFFGGVDTVTITGLSTVGAGPGADSVTGTANDDLLDGGDGDDIIDGGDGNDTLRGARGGDTLMGGLGIDTLTGGADNDILTGGLDPDFMDGGDGDDTFVWNNGDGSDGIDGGAGEDTVIVNGGGDDDSFTIEANGARVSFFRGFPNFNLDIGTVEQIQVNGLGGSDSLEVRDITGTGVNLVLFDGGEGNDTLDGTAASVVLEAAGGEGDDTLRTGGAADLLNGEGGADTLVGGPGGDTKNGGADDDLMIWNNGDGSDVMNGDGGTDTVQVNGSTGSGDAFNVQANGARVVFQRTNLGPFSLDIGTTETLDVNGGGGDDSLTVGGLAGTGLATVDFFGDEGNDILDGTATATPIIANGGNGDDSLDGGSGADNLMGGEGADNLAGGPGDDTVDGGGGDDRMFWRSGDGSDQMNGGPGADHLLVDADPLGGDDTDNSFTFTFLVDGAEVVTRIAIGADALELRQIETVEVNGGGGDDTVTIGPDTGPASVTVRGGGGDDTLIVVSSTIVANGLGGEGNDVMSGAGGDDGLQGEAGNDTLSGESGFDTLIGGEGNDILDGGVNPAGQGDFLLGGDGDDTYHVDSPLDFVDEGNFPAFAGFGFGGTDTIVSTADFFWDLYSIGETLQVSEGAVDVDGDGVTIVHSVFSGELIGRSGTEIMFGRGGSDTYRPGGGVDFMSFSTLGVMDVGDYEANGVNTLVMAPGNSYDIVFEAEVGRDVFDLTAFDIASVDDLFANGFDDGIGNCYFILGDGLDYLYLVGLELAELDRGDFVV